MAADPNQFPETQDTPGDNVARLESAFALAQAAEVSIQPLRSWATMKADLRRIGEKARIILANESLRESFWSNCATHPAEGAEFIRNLLKDTKDPEAINLAVGLLSTNTNPFHQTPLYTLAKSCPEIMFGLIEKMPLAAQWKLLFETPYVADAFREHRGENGLGSNELKRHVDAIERWFRDAPKEAAPAPVA